MTRTAYVLSEDWPSEAQMPPGSVWAIADADNPEISHNFGGAIQTKQLHTPTLDGFLDAAYALPVGMRHQPRVIVSAPGEDARYGAVLGMGTSTPQAFYRSDRHGDWTKLKDLFGKPLPDNVEEFRQAVAAAPDNDGSDAADRELLPFAYVRADATAPPRPGVDQSRTPHPPAYTGNAAAPTQLPALNLEQPFFVYLPPTPFGRGQIDDYDPALAVVAVGERTMSYRRGNEIVVTNVDEGRSAGTSDPLATMGAVKRAIEDRVGALGGQLYLVSIGQHGGLLRYGNQPKTGSTLAHEFYPINQINPTTGGLQGKWHSLSESMLPHAPGVVSELGRLTREGTERPGVIDYTHAMMRGFLLGRGMDQYNRPISPSEPQLRPSPETLQQTVAGALKATGGLFEALRGHAPGSPHQPTPPRQLIERRQPPRNQHDLPAGSRQRNGVAWGARPDGDGPGRRPR